jgi:microcystin-dependent protein
MSTFGVKEKVDIVSINGSSFISGTIIQAYPPIGGSTSKDGWLICDGTTYNISSYPTLGALLLSTYGGDGITTFAVPSMNDKVLVPYGYVTANTYNASITNASTHSHTAASNASLITGNVVSGNASVTTHSHAIAVNTDSGLTDVAHNHAQQYAYYGYTGGNPTNAANKTGNARVVIAGVGHNHLTRSLVDWAANANENHSHSGNAGNTDSPSTDHTHTTSVSAVTSSSVSSIPTPSIYIYYYIKV